MDLISVPGETAVASVRLTHFRSCPEVAGQAIGACCRDGDISQCRVMETARGIRGGELPCSDAAFGTTQWSVVVHAAETDWEEASGALAALCLTYWHPIYAYIRRAGHPSEDARDMTQEFFALLLAKRYLNAADPEKGKFRSFLLTVLKRFMANEWDRKRRLKRGGGVLVLPLSEEGAEAERGYRAVRFDDLTPGEAFDRRWAIALLDRVLTRLEGEWREKGRVDQFLALRVFLTGEEVRGDYGGKAQGLGMTEGALRVAVHRLRERYRELLRFEIAQTVIRPEQIEEEIRSLFQAFSP